MEGNRPAPGALGDPLPPRCQVLEIRIGELNQMFNAMDPAPFRERDLDPRAEEFIVEWARELRHDGPLGLVVQLDRQSGTKEEAAMLRDAVHEFFTQRAHVTRQRLRQVLRVGRTSLVIGLVFLTTSIVVSNQVGAGSDAGNFGGIVRESLLIGGWVAMWRPLEVFLYDWWPILRDARLLDRMAAMAVQIVQSSAVKPSRP
ncbi:MAG: hypothetical protein ABI665_08590 [Vicinamibacterales bacterium]